MRAASRTSTVREARTSTLQRRSSWSTRTSRVTSPTRPRKSPGACCGWRRAAAPPRRWPSRRPEPGQSSRRRRTLPSVPPAWRAAAFVVWSRARRPPSSRWLADEAAALHVLAQAQMALGNLEGSMDAAEQAVAGWRRLGRGTELVASLGVLVQAHVRQGNPLAGLRASNRELSEQRRNGSPRGVADVLRFIADTHSTLGEPVSALHNAQEALGIYTALGDQLSQASVLLRIAELQPLVGALAEATSSGELALKMFRTIGHRRGEEEAMSILSGLLVTRGLPEQAPRRAEALELARELARAVEARDAGRVEALEDALADLGGLVTGEDIRTALAPVLLGDPAAAGFLQGLGWDMRWATGGHATLACCTPREFYAGAQAAGMSYGPQFRTVHPARLGSHREGSAVALAVLQLPADDRWQARMGFRPGILDGALQCQGMLDR
ncbi:unnamed protein product [Prorocentrum cordatum]|uniref:Polyketide synthase dehydratase domain-containing protein n=1 Tax=Prorocentrum cordatum TaxID=2364126 RepID=A0ABN9TNY3_9DINO|nr:unnamed protein product [Polarella glacialis]